MSYTVVPMTAARAAEVADWHYPAPFDVYDLSPGSIPGLLTVENAYHAVLSGTELVGFCCFGRDAQVPAGREVGWYGPDGLDVGLGMRPDLTGRGAGVGFVSAVVAAAERWRPACTSLRMTVAAFNQRALRVYEAVGFTPGADAPAGGYRLLVRPIGRTAP